MLKSTSGFHDPDTRSIAESPSSFHPTPSQLPVLGAFPHTAETRYPSIVGKWGIDATKPVPYRAAERKNYERAWPLNWGRVKLDDYLGEDPT